MSAHLKKVYVSTNVLADHLAFIGKCLSKAGYESESIALLNEDNYRRRSRSNLPCRLLMRLQMYVGYPAYLVWRVLTSRRGSIFIVTSNTFYAALMVSLVGPLVGATTIHLLYDLFPDALIAAGKIKRNSIAVKILGFITRCTQQNCSTIYLGEFLRQHAESQWGTPHHSAIIDISADADEYMPKLEEAGYLPIGFHYGGQLGYMHDAESLIASLKRVWAKPDFPARCTFYVAGAQSEYVRQSLMGTSLLIKPTVLAAEWRKLVVSDQIGLVTLSPCGASICLPSKTYGMMAAGLCIIAICPKWSDLGRLVIENNVGWVISNSPHETISSSEDREYIKKLTDQRPAEDVAVDFEALLTHILAFPAEIMERRVNARNSMLGRFSAQSLAPKWNSIIEAAFADTN